jgi:hypothetical protein
VIVFVGVIVGVAVTSKPLVILGVGVLVILGVIV